MFLKTKFLAFWWLSIFFVLSFIYLFCLSYLWPSPSWAEEIKLGTSEVTERVLEHNYGVRINKILASRSQEDLRQYNSLFDTEAFSSISYQRDELERTSNLFSDSDTINYGVGLRKKFITGTGVEVSWDHNRIEEDMSSFFTTINPYNDRLC